MEKLKESSSRTAACYLPLPPLYFSGEYEERRTNLRCSKNILLQLASNICYCYKNAKDKILHCVIVTPVLYRFLQAGKRKTVCNL